MHPCVHLSVLLFLLQTPCGFGSFNRDLTEVLESQERELENRRSSMMTMELLLAELNSERSAKNEEIQRLKVQTKLFLYLLLKNYLVFPFGFRPGECIYIMVEF